MKLSKLYTNMPDRFAAVTFRPGLNVVLAEIRLPENRAKDTHNLGKTLLGRVIDFCLLSRKDRQFSLFKHKELFKDFVFFLEIALIDGSFVTVRREVAEPSKASLKRHLERHQDYVVLSETAWDHHRIAFDKAKEILDGTLDLRDLGGWSYRKLAGYLLRSQDDFRDVYQLRQFASSHSAWKPMLAHLLGFDGSIVEQHYAKEEELDARQNEEKVIKRELGGTDADWTMVEGKLLLKERDAQKKQTFVDSFDFRRADKEKTKIIVEELDGEIARLNQDRYSLSLSRTRLTASLADDVILFDPSKAQALFAESGVLFAGQIKKDFEQLVSFNRAIADERREYLKEELAEVGRDLQRINGELSRLGKRRKDELAFLASSDVFAKYKQLSGELVTLRADIDSLRRQLAGLSRLRDLRNSIRALVDEKAQVEAEMDRDVRLQHEKRNAFETTRVFFNQVVEDVIDRKALLGVSLNQRGHLEFKAEILDDSGNTTSADAGHTYRKLLCVAFDLAIARAHIQGRYPRFVFHDGVFESLDDRKKLNLMSVIREHCALGIQHIITLIDSDLPAAILPDEPFFHDSEIILRLHDEDESGRLFKMAAW